MGFGSVRHTTIAIETHPHPDLPLEGEGEKTSKTSKKSRAGATRAARTWCMRDLPMNKAG
jgi:hypothetical protein